MAGVVNKVKPIKSIRESDNRTVKKKQRENVFHK